MRFLMPLLVVPAVAHGLSVLPVSHEDAARTADGIVRGSVVAAETVPTAAALPVTRLTLAVAERLKGPSTETIVLEFVGGSIDGEVHEVVGLRVPAVGDDLVVFYRDDRSAGLSNVVGVNQWYFWAAPDPRRFGETVLRTAEGLVVVGIAEGRIRARRVPAEGAASTAGVDTMTRQVQPAALIDANGREHPVAENRRSTEPPPSMPWTTFRNATLGALRAGGVAR